jgi:ADP-heptose:LPS heptosyltransferase
MRIFGTVYNLVGDLIICLPYLNYFEKKYPGSYKIWGIYRKVDFCAPLYFNHPLIDRIHITDKHASFGDRDKELMDTCDIVIPPMRGGDRRWYNKMGPIEARALWSGLDLEDMRKVMDPEDWVPRLERWFEPGFETTQSTYSRTPDIQPDHSDVIAIFPGAGTDLRGKRIAGNKWWDELIKELIKEGYRVFHFGHPLEESITDNPKYTQYISLPFMSQIKLCLSTKLTIGTDSGSMWVVGAYAHPAIHLMGYWLRGHRQNPTATAPINENSVTIFKKEGVSNIQISDVIEAVGDMP